MLNKTKSFVEIFIILILFLFFYYIIQTNLELIKESLNDNLGMSVYVLITIVAIVIAPISTLPLLPIASNLWGWVTAAVLSIIGWTIGSLIAFILARKYGVSLISKFISIEKINKFEKMVPKENFFWGVVFLRMVVPVDILSYALGLFSKIKTKSYFFATLIGVTPFAFVFAYAGKMPFVYQILALLLALVIILFGLMIRRIRLGS